jgi:hypothetical protein
MAQPGYGQPAPSTQNNTLGLLALILGIAAIPLTCCFYIGVPVGIAAIVLGYLGKQKAERGEASNRGQAVAGLICGAVAVGLAIVLIILTVVLSINLPAMPS